MKWDNRSACALGFFWPREDLPKPGQVFKSLERAVGFVFSAGLLQSLNASPWRSVGCWPWAGVAGLGAVEETWGREDTSPMLLLTQVLDLAAIRNESKNISSCLFSGLLQWAIREQGFGGEEVEAKSLQVARGAVFRSCDCCLVFFGRAM